MGVSFFTLLIYLELKPSMVGQMIDHNDGVRILWFVERVVRVYKQHTVVSTSFSWKIIWSVFDFLVPKAMIGFLVRSGHTMHQLQITTRVVIRRLVGHHHHR